MDFYPKYNPSVSESGWMHKPPLTPNQTCTLSVAISFFAGIPLLIFVKEGMWDAVLGILGFLAVMYALAMFFYNFCPVNACPDCRQVWDYDPRQKVCGMCGYRPKNRSKEAIKHMESIACEES